MFARLHPDPESIAATDRATPPCPHFGPCGGCQLQQLTYAAQLSVKADRLRALLAPLNLALPELRLHPSPPLAYRNRIRLTLAEVDGQLRAGYLRALPQVTEERAISFLPITECPIAAPLLWRAAAAFLALANQESAAWRSNADQLEISVGADESRLNLTLYLRTRSKRESPITSAAFTSFCETLRASVPELIGAGIALLPAASAQRSRRTEAARTGATCGSSGLNYRIADTDYWVPRGAFFQTNRFLIPELLSLATADRTGVLAWDLYAGVGLFSRTLARTFAQVTAVEIAEPAATALASTKLANLRAIKATTLDFLRAAVIQRERPDLIVLDPPRTGAGPEVCTLLARIAAPTLVYVSCSPQTLPADLATLSAAGYSISELHLVDLFPQTMHLETVAILTR